MRFVAERIRPLYLRDLARALRHLALVGEGQGWLQPEEVSTLRRWACRAAAGLPGGAETPAGAAPDAAPARTTRLPDRDYCP